MNPVPKFELGQEIWFGGLTKQYNGYIVAIHLDRKDMIKNSYDFVTYSVDLGIGDSKLCIKEEHHLYNSREELIKNIKETIKSLKLRGIKDLLGDQVKDETK